jgi:Meckel syndrome type 1 protein
LRDSPVIHSDLGVDHLFGATDQGASGIALFLRSHKCNDVCRMLKLPNNTAFVEENIGQLEHSSVNTSLISIVHTRHLRERQVERNLDDKQLQAAKKHGTKERQPNGTLRHVYGDVQYVTSKDQSVGVTTFERDVPGAEPAAKARGGVPLGLPRSKRPAAPPEPAIIPVVTVERPSHRPPGQPKPSQPSSQQPSEEAPQPLPAAASVDEAALSAVGSFAVASQAAGYSGAAPATEEPATAAAAAAFVAGVGARGRGRGRGGRGGRGLALPAGPLPPDAVAAGGPVPGASGADGHATTLPVGAVADGTVAPAPSSTSCSESQVVAATAPEAEEATWEAEWLPYLRAEMVVVKSEGESLYSWYKGLEINKRLLLDNNLTKSEKADIQEASPEGFKISATERRREERRRKNRDVSEATGAEVARDAAHAVDDDPGTGNVHQAASEAEARPSGLKWRKIGSKKPSAGEELTNERLSAELGQRKGGKTVEFTQAEWASFGITGLRAHHFILASSQTAYFQPLVEKAVVSASSAAAAAVTAARKAKGYAALMAADQEGRAKTDAELNEEFKKQRKEEKRERQRQEKLQQKAIVQNGGPMLESNEEPDALEQQLAKKHSKAPTALFSKAIADVAKAPMLKRLSTHEIDAMTMAKQLRRALQDRGISEKDCTQFKGKPDEVAKLRAYARSLPAVCEDAHASSKSSRFFKHCKEDGDDIDEILKGIDKKDDGDKKDHSSGVAGPSASTDGIDTASGVFTGLIGSMKQVAQNRFFETKNDEQQRKYREGAVRKAKLAKAREDKETADFERLTGIDRMREQAEKEKAKKAPGDGGAGEAKA